MRILAVALAGASCLLPAARLPAQQIDEGRIREAVDRALPPIQISLEVFNGSKPTIKEFPSCVSCHHEAIGLMTLAVARRRGFAVDEELERTEAGLLHDFFKKMQPVNVRALAGDPDAEEKADPFGDLSAIVGYLAGGLIDHGHERDAATEAAALILMQNQHDDGRWTFRMPRVPMQSSDFTTTAMAIRVLRVYTPKSHADRADMAIAQGRAWLLAGKPRTTDDKAFRLLGLRWAGADPEEVCGAVGPLRADQRADGGWAQLPDPEMPSDAYATGLALFALNQGGGMPATDPAYRRGLAFLLDSQADDGTWRVAKRATAYQRYFDAGFPYGEDQYISLPGTCWATMAMALAVEPPK